MQQYIGFRLDDGEYTIPILKVLEIVNTPPVTRLPQSPPYFAGIINLRGGIVPVLDLKSFMSMGSTPAEGTKVIVVSNDAAKLGILVDSITSVISIKDSDIETSGDIVKLQPVKGVARLKDRMVVMLDAGRLIDGAKLPVETPPDEASPAAAIPSPVEMRADEAGAGPDEARHKFMESVIEIIDRLAVNDYERLDGLISNILQSPDSDLYREIGTVTRKLHDSIQGFRRTLDPRFKDIVRDEVPTAVDKLQFVMRRAEEAATKTIEIADRHIGSAGELSRHAGRLDGPRESLEYLDSLSRSLSADMTEILVAQEFHDINEQTIRKVLGIVLSIEADLVSLIARFGFRTERDEEGEIPAAGTVTQDEVDDILKEFGF